MFQEFPDDKNDDFLNEFRQKIAEQSAANFEEKRMEMRRSKSVFIGAVSGVALAAVVGWFVLSPRYAVDNPEEIPIIRRPQWPQNSLVVNRYSSSAFALAGAC